MVSPNFSTKKKTANQPIRAAVPVNPFTKKGCDWMLGENMEMFSGSPTEMTQKSPEDF